MLLNNKYFVSILTTIGMQFVLGINSSFAVPCEDKVDTGFNYNGDYGAPVGKVWEFLWGNIHAKFTSVDDAKNKLYETANSYIDNRYQGDKEECVRDSKYDVNGGIELLSCMNQVLANNGCDPSVFKKDGANPQRNSSANKPASSRSSSQATKKSNQQATNNQSNQGGSADISKMSRNQLFDAINLSIKEKDFIKAYSGLQQLSKDPDPEISRQALRKIGEYLYLGQRVKQDQVQAVRFFEQALNMGDLESNNHLCEVYRDGYGVEKNHRKAIQYCTVTAEKGERLAQSNLSYLYSSADGSNQNQQ